MIQGMIDKLELAKERLEWMKNETYDYSFDSIAIWDAAVNQLIRDLNVL